MKSRLPVVAAIISTLCLYSHHAGAAVTIDNFVITGTTISFGISGTLPVATPAVDKESFFFVNPDPSADPGFALGDFTNAGSQSFTGGQALDSVLTGNSFAGDYFVINFQNGLSAGESVSGTFTATWNSAFFDPSQVTSLDLYWGTSNLLSFNSGTLLTSISTVPEVSSVSLLIAGAVVVLPIRRRRK